MKIFVLNALKIERFNFLHKCIGVTSLFRTLNNVLKTLVNKTLFIYIYIYIGVKPNLTNKKK